MLYKKCRLCSDMKEITEFHKKNGAPDGVRNECKECVKDIQKKYKEAPGFKEKQKEYDKKRYDELREQILQRKREYHIENRETILIKKKEYRDRPENKERLKEYSAIYRIENKEKFYKYRRENPHCIAWRSILHSTLKRLGTFKQDHTINMLGYSALELKNHIENLFTEGMSWKNYGLYNGELNHGWDIDHIIPLASAKTVEDVLRLNHYTNLQPLCSKVNRDIKKDRLN